MMVCGTPCFCAAAKISLAGPKHAGQAFAVEDLQLPRRQAGSLIPWASFVDVDMHWDAKANILICDNRCHYLCFFNL
jgi:hypothetical protein